METAISIYISYQTPWHPFPAIFIDFSVKRRNLSVLFSSNLHKKSRKKLDFIAPAIIPLFLEVRIFKKKQQLIGVSRTKFKQHFRSFSILFIWICNASRSSKAASQRLRKAFSLKFRWISQDQLIQDECFMQED